MPLYQSLDLSSYFLAESLNLCIFYSDLLIEDVPEFLLFYFIVVLNLLKFIGLYNELELIFVRYFGFFLFNF